jgi:hypothetical protein
VTSWTWIGSGGPDLLRRCARDRVVLRRRDAERRVRAATLELGERAGCLNASDSRQARRGGHGLRQSDSLVLSGTGHARRRRSTSRDRTPSRAARGAVFGDGLLCLGGSICASACTSTCNGASQFPAAGDPRSRVAGNVQGSAALLPGVVPRRFFLLHGGHLQPLERLDDGLGSLKGTIRPGELGYFERFDPVRGARRVPAGAAFLSPGLNPCSNVAPPCSLAALFFGASDAKHSPSSTGRTRTFTRSR